eukprot:15260847-Alexandrium_andersonii.AAC.1
MHKERQLNVRRQAQSREIWTNACAFSAAPSLFKHIHMQEEMECTRKGSTQEWLTTGMLLTDGMQTEQRNEYAPGTT